MITGRFNHTIIETRPSAEEAVYELAQDIASEARIRAQKGQSYTLGLATGSSPPPPLSGTHSPSSQRRREFPKCDHFQFRRVFGPLSRFRSQLHLFHEGAAF